MYNFRRSVAIYLVFIFGMLLGKLNKDLIFIIGTPILLILIMKWDEVSFNKKRSLQVLEHSKAKDR